LTVSAGIIRTCNFWDGNYLTVEQANRLLECARQDRSAQVYPFILIALETSMRMMEILSIRREHVDVHRNTIYIPKAKSGARQQPITSNLVEFLPSYIDSLPEGCPWLFPSALSESGHTMDIRKSYGRVVEAAELDSKIVLRHTLRHTAITHLVQSGVDLPTVARISGHKTLEMVARYAHNNGEHIQAAMDKLENRYKKTG
jgi:integrase